MIAQLAFLLNKISVEIQDLGNICAKNFNRFQKLAYESVPSTICDSTEKRRCNVNTFHVHERDIIEVT